MVVVALVEVREVGTFCALLADALDLRHHFRYELRLRGDAGLAQRVLDR